MDPPLDSSPHGVFKRLELEAERETRQREARATKDRGALMDTISIAFRRPPTVLFAKASAQRFGKEFRIGASEATHQLEKLKRTRPDLAKPWLNTPKGRRVFIIGSSADNPDVVRLRDSLRAKAFECFFYKFCESETTPLCSSQEVGAFFGTAGHIVTVTSRAAKASDYIPVEIGSAKKHLQGGMIIVITPESLLKLSAASGTAVAANVVFLDDRRQPRRQG